MIPRRQRFATSVLLILCLSFLSLGAGAVDPASIVISDSNTCENDTQCVNGGVCAEPNNIHSRKYCHCSVGYVGFRCNSYCPLECQNGGYCRYHETSEPSRQFEVDRNPADYMCQCFGLFEGDLCDISYVNCGDGNRCYNRGRCKLPTTTTAEAGDEATSTSSCHCPIGFGGPTCQSAREEDDLPSAMKSVKEGFQGNKAALICGVLFVVVLFAVCSWYSVVFCLAGNDESYQSVTGFSMDASGGEKAPKWRNIV